MTYMSPPRAIRYVQLHWQCRDDPRKTVFVAQYEFSPGTDFFVVNDWVGNLLMRRWAEKPEGWEPMVCTEDSEFFVWAASPCAG